jgi:hypothetical protein
MPQRGYRLTAKTMREQTGAMPCGVDETLRLRKFLVGEPGSTSGSSPGQAFAETWRYRFAPLIWVFCSSVSDA